MASGERALAKAFPAAVNLPPETINMTANFHLLDTLYHAHNVCLPYNSLDWHAKVCTPSTNAGLLSQHYLVKGGICHESAVLIVAVLNEMGFKAYRTAGESFMEAQHPFQLKR